MNQLIFHADQLIWCSISGYKFGWHGETDIIIQEIPVSVHESAAEMKPKPDAKVSVNSIEVKNTPWFSLDNEAQMKAQTITFSPLQVKYNKTELRNCLIPGIGIGRRDVVAFFYDSEYDILLRSDDMALFLDQELTYSVVIFLWLTLNYRLFCSGLTEEMNRFKAGFFDVVDFEEFINNVERPMHIKPSEESVFQKRKPSANPACSRFKRPPRPDIKYKDPQ